MKDVTPVNSWGLCMMDTSKGSTKKNVSELVGEWEWKDFRIKKKHIYYYERRGGGKLERNEVWGKERLFDSLFSLEVDKAILQQTELQATDTTRLDHISFTIEKSQSCPAKSLMWSNISHVLVCLTLQVLTRLYVIWFLEFLDWRKVRKRTYFWLILSYPCYILVIPFWQFLRGWSF